MATPRKRYFRVADSILREPWPREHKLALVLLMAHLNTRWARDGIPTEECGRCSLSEGAVFDVTGRKRIRSGFALLRELSERVSFTVELRDGYVFVDWPKFAEFQHSGPRSEGEVEPRKEPPPLSALRSPTPPPEKEESEPAAPGPDRATSKRVKRSQSEPSEDAQRLTGLLVAMIEEAGPEGTRIREGPWQRDIDLMIRRDGRSPPEVQQVIEWLRVENPRRDTPFVVLSAKSLREKYDRIRAQMRTRPSTGGPSHGRRQTTREAAIALGWAEDG